jgi:hypothetical protein
MAGDELHSVMRFPCEDNQQCFEGFLKAGEQVTLIDESFEQIIESLLNY